EALLRGAVAGVRRLRERIRDRVRARRERLSELRGRRRAEGRRLSRLDLGLRALELGVLGARAIVVLRGELAEGAGVLRAQLHVALERADRAEVVVLLLVRAREVAVGLRALRVLRDL